MGNHSDPYGQAPKFTLSWDILVDSLEACTEKNPYYSPTDVLSIYHILLYLSYFARLCSGDKQSHILVA